VSGLTLPFSPLEDLTQEDHLGTVAFSSDGQYVLTASRDGTARLWDASSGQEVIRIQLGDDLSAVGYTPDGKYLAAASLEGATRI
jgi:WD40 repeat protein